MLTVTATLTLTSGKQHTTTAHPHVLF